MPFCTETEVKNMHADFKSLQDERDELRRKLFVARVGLSNIMVPRPSPECLEFYVEAANLQRIAKETLAETE